MSNKTINEKLQNLRNEYSAATPERKGKITEEATDLKKQYVKCAQCHTQFPPNDEREYGFCGEDCREEYYASARSNSKLMSLKDMQDGLAKMAQRAKNKLPNGWETYEKATKIFKS